MFWFVAIICCITLLPFLGLTEFNTKGEPREAVVSMSMLQQDNWILPVNNGGEMPYKPPFFHWLIAICSLFTGGEVTEYSSRLPSALALVATALGTFLFYARRRGNLTGVAAAMICFTSWELHRAGMNCRVDMVLTALTVWSIILLFQWGERSMKGVPWIAILLMSCGTLTKGPVGAIVPCLVVGIYLLLRGKRFWVTLSRFILWGLMAFVIPLAWYYAAWLQGGQEFLDLVLEENLGRMTNTMSYDSCVNPWPYNIVTLIAGYLPWTLAAVMALLILPWKKWFGSKAKDIWHNLAVSFRKMSPEGLLSLTAVVVIFVFYCIPQSKRSVYLMPLYPFLALFIAELLQWMSARRIVILKILGDILAVAGILLPILFITIKAGCIPDSIFGHGRHASHNIAMLHALRDAGGFMTWLWVSVSPILSILWWCLWRNRLSGNRLTVAISMVILGIYVSMAGTYQPAVLNVRSAKPVARQIEETVPANAGIYEFVSYGEFALGDPVHYFELNFYLGDRIRNFIKERPTEGYLVTSDRDAELYFKQFEASGYSLKPVAPTAVQLMKEPASIYRFHRDSGDTRPISLTEIKE